MQYKVPQNIDLEDKIVGPFTAKQFIYLLVGFCAIYIIVLIFGTGFFGIMFITPTALLTISLVFVRIQDRPFEKFLAAVFLYIARPKRRLWARRGDPPNLVIKKTKKQEFKPVIRERITKSTLEQLSSNLDTRGNQPILSLREQDNAKAN